VAGVRNIWAIVATLYAYRVVRIDTRVIRRRELKFDEKGSVHLVSCGSPRESHAYIEEKSENHAPLHD
jgi:hypothetical protein